MLEDGAVTLGDGVVRLVDDDEIEVLRVERGEALVPGAADGRYGGDHHLTIRRGAFPRLLDLDGQVRIRVVEFLQGLLQQLLAVGEHEQPLLHAEVVRELGKDDGLAGTGGQGDEHPPLPLSVPLP